MRHASTARPARQVAAACRRLADSPGLPFAEYLPEQQVEDAVRAQGVTFRNRLFSPPVTLWTFLSQVRDPDPSCRQAVARYAAWRVARGLPACSSDTGAYCKARARLPEQALADLTRDTGRRLAGRAQAPWLWKGRQVKVADGTGLSMPDTEANQKAYPQTSRSSPGCGFPLMRLVVLFSLAVGTVLDAVMGPHKGKGNGEQSLYREMQGGLSAGDVLLGDRGFCSYWVVAGAKARGADVVLRINTQWQKRLPACKRLGNGNRLLRVAKPRRPAWMSAEEYAAVPDEVCLRAARVRVRQRGFRTREYVVVTTLLEPSEASSEELGELYRARWQAELDLRSLKETLGMDVLRCETPEMVRREVWAHLLSYNLVRGVMAEAAAQAGCLPREVSLAGAVQQLNAFLPYLGLARDAQERARLWQEMLRAVARHRVGNRPDRVEPRVIKRRTKNFPWMTEPRAQARKRLRKTG